MKKWLALVAIVILFGCAKEIIQKPRFETANGEQCAADCETVYADCLASNIRPDFLISSPRKKACQKLIRDCYQLCQNKERQSSSASSQ